MFATRTTLVSVLAAGLACLGSWSCETPATTTASQPAASHALLPVAYSQALIVMRPVLAGPLIPDYAQEFAFEDSTVLLGPPQIFHVKQASRSQDALGLPALNIKIVEDEHGLLQRWTAQNLHKPIAILVDETVLCLPIVQQPLPGRFRIQGGGEGFNESTMQYVLARLQPR